MKNKKTKKSKRKQSILTAKALKHLPLQFNVQFICVFLVDGGKSVGVSDGRVSTDPFASALCCSHRRHARWANNWRSSGERLEPLVERGVRGWKNYSVTQPYLVWGWAGLGW